MYAAMIVFNHPFPKLEPTSWSCWLMQAAMVIGFATTCPLNGWLIRRGTEEAI